MGIDGRVDARARHGLRKTFLASSISATITLLAGEAWADCTPAAADNVTATCSNTTTNQGGGAPGTSADSSGYGTGIETGVTVNSSGFLSGTAAGIYLGGGTVTNTSQNSPSQIVGNQYGIRAATGSLNVTNNVGAIVSGGGGVGAVGIQAATDVTVVNSGSVQGYAAAIQALAGSANVTNNFGFVGAIQAGGYAIQANSDVTVINSGSILALGGGAILSNFGNANVTNNSGTIVGNSGSGIQARAVTVINNAGALISGALYGIDAQGVSSASSVFNAGQIEGGSAAIRFSAIGNTLTLGPGSDITGNVLGGLLNTFQLGGTGTASFDISQVGSKYQNFTTFNKIDDSVWTLTGTSSYAGPVNVNGGTLNVTGNVASATGITVNAGATLGGTGTLGATVVASGGTLSPGNGTAGTSLSVTGNLAFSPGASYLVQVNPTTASSTVVNGSATLGGATVNLNFAAGAYVVKQSTVILTTTGGLGSTFGGVTSTNMPTNVHPTLSYDSNNAYIGMALSFVVPGGLTGNQAAVANTLTHYFDTTGSIPTIFATLSPAALSQAAGEGASGSQQSTFNAMTQFTGVMSDPFVAGRSDGADVSNSPFGFAGEQALAYAAKKRDPNDALAAIYTKAPPVLSFQQRWSVWAAGFGGSQTTDGNAAVGANTATSRIYGTAVGADYRFSPFTIAGFALAGGGTNFSVANNGTGRSDLFQAGAFIRHTIGAAYLSGALAYGWQDVTTDRTVTIAGIDQLRARFNSNAWSSRLEGGYRFVAPWIGGVGIAPYAAGQFTTFDLPAYAESVISGANTFALAYGAKTVTDNRSEIGARTDKSFAILDAVLTLRGRVAWAHDFNPNRGIGATFQTLPGASFVVNGAAQASDSALVTASAEARWMNGWSTAATFEGEFSNMTRSYAGKGVVRYAW